jgi:glycosyltransferase involved in cell wall biosynthesis
MSASLYVPARNAAFTLERCLDAIARLEPAPRRVLVVVDDKSRDRTLEIARARAGIEVVLQPRPGLTAARNHALELLDDEWVAALDADVVPAPDWLGALLAARRQFPRAVAISGRSEDLIAGTGDVWRALMHPHHWGSFPIDNPFMVVSDALFHRPALLRVGGYRERLERYGDDSRLSRDLRDAGFRLAYTPDARAAHVRSDSIVSALDLRWSYAEPRLGEQLDDLDGLRKKLEKNLEYGRLGVYRGRSAGVPELVLMGVLLPFHHALRDASAMLGRRHFVSEREREVALGSLHQRLLAVARVAPRFARFVRDELGEPVTVERGLDWPAWPDFVAAVEDSLNGWLEECAQVLEAAVPAFEREAPVADWAARFGAPADPSQPAKAWPAPRSVSPWTELDGAERATGQESAVIPGSYADAVVLRAGDAAPLTAVESLVIPALQSVSRPRAFLARVLPKAGRVLLRYRPPARVAPGEILLASDVAEACAGAGLGIERFETQVGAIVIEARR